MDSILQQEKECFFCGSRVGLESHHCIHGTANRKNSEKYGLKVWLCQNHHTGNDGVHRRREKDLELIKLSQKAFEAQYGDRDAFRAIFGKSWL